MPTPAKTTIKRMATPRSQWRIPECDRAGRSRKAAMQKHARATTSERASRLKHERRTNTAAAAKRIDVRFLITCTLMRLGIRQTCLSPHFGMIGQQTPALDETFLFIKSGFTKSQA